MKGRETHRFLQLLLCMACLFPLSRALGQRGRLTADREDEGRQRPPLVIRDLDGTGSRATVRTPSYDSSYGRGSKPAREWGRLQAEYDSYPEWIDEMTVTFYAMSLNEDGERNYSLYRRDVRYMDIKEDREHLAVVYIRPSALERYGEIVAVAVEFVIDGEIVAVDADSTMGKSLPSDWWKNPRVVKSELVTRRDGYMLSRKESPFAFVAIDDYEVIK